MPRPLSKVWTLSNEEFAEIVAHNLCIRDIVAELGFVPTSGSMAIVVKKRIKRDGLNIAHLVGRNAKGCSNPQYTLEEILIENSTYSSISRLKTRLVNEGLLKYECAGCGNNGIWNGKPLVLQLHHKNGKHDDHRIGNLRFLCPNCHAQTETFSGRNADKNGQVT